jgi:hypothetical protein
MNASAEREAVRGSRLTSRRVHVNAFREATRRGAWSAVHVVDSRFTSLVRVHVNAVAEVAAAKLSVGVGSVRAWNSLILLW